MCISGVDIRIQLKYRSQVFFWVFFRESLCICWGMRFDRRDLNKRSISCIIYPPPPPLESIERTKGARQNLSCLSILSQSRTQKSILKQCKLIPLKFRWNLCWSFRNVSHYYRQQSSGLLSLRRSEDERNLAFLGLNRKIKYYKKTEGI